jgi:argininosuccinate lyase
VAGALDLARRVVALGSEVVATLRVDRAAMAAAAGAHFTGATDLAEELVLRHDLDYRSAYRVVGRAVATAVDAGRTTLDAGDLARAAAQVLDRDLLVDPRLVADALDPVSCALHRRARGGSAPDRVREHCALLAKRVDAAERWRQQRQAEAGAAEAALVATARRLAGH